MKVRDLIIAVMIGLTAAHAAIADDAHHKNTDAKTAAGAALAEGEIRKVDKGAGKVTIRHGPIKNLDMPAMTMVFQVKDPAMLDLFKSGDRINFVADKVNGAYTVMQLETVK
jgi:Cu(I)/Ag(I) efflux system periplasmic protein CusF